MASPIRSTIGPVQNRHGRPNINGTLVLQGFALHITQRFLPNCIILPIFRFSFLSYIERVLKWEDTRGDGCWPTGHTREAPREGESETVQQNCNPISISDSAFQNHTARLCRTGRTHLHGQHMRTRLRTISGECMSVLNRAGSSAFVARH